MLVSIGEPLQTVGLTMEIDITKVPVLWITIDSAVERHKKMQNIFSTFGFSNTHQVNGEVLDKTGLSFIEIQKKKTSLVGNSHIKALQMFEPPFIILEDDIGIIDSSFKAQISIPNDADCIYLGSSIWGMNEGQSVCWGTKKMNINNEYCRVEDMLGIHAILYLSEKYIQHTIQNLLTCRSKQQYCDECIAMDMKNHKVYCRNYPMFFQDDGTNNLVTSVPMADYK